MLNPRAYSAASSTSPLVSTVIARRDPSDKDVQIEILFCGICHSDLHTARNEWSSVMPTIYPCVPGHEIVGRVTKVGPRVTKFKAGDLAGVGCLVHSDGTCAACKEGRRDLWGYSDSIVVDERFVLTIPANLDLAAGAPLLCAGITTCSTMRHWGVTAGKKVGIVGLAALGIWA